MKRIGGLWHQVVAFENLWLAADKARRGKRSRSVVQRFEFRREWELLRLRDELLSGTYRPGEFCTHWITQPKPRLISAAPYRDRVLHHALMTVLEPIFDARFHPDSYACRKGKGTHAASRRLQQLMRRFKYALQLDVCKFFPSLDHEFLKESFRRLIKDRQVLRLMDTIVDASNEQESVAALFPEEPDRKRGLPIGNLTSQWFANWFLTAADHVLSSHWGVGGQVRYCDDRVLLGNDKKQLRDIGERLRELMVSHGLRLHEDCPVVPVREGLTFVGYRTWSSHRTLPRNSVRRFRRRLRGMLTAKVTRTVRQVSLAGWCGHAEQVNSKRILVRLLSIPRY